MINYFVKSRGTPGGCFVYSKVRSVQCVCSISLCGIMDYSTCLCNIPHGSLGTRYALLDYANRMCGCNGRLDQALAIAYQKEHLRCKLGSRKKVMRILNQYKMSLMLHNYPNYLYSSLRKILLLFLRIRLDRLSPLLPIRWTNLPMLFMEPQRLNQPNILSNIPSNR